MTNLYMEVTNITKSYNFTQHYLKGNVILQVFSTARASYITSLVLRVHRLTRRDANSCLHVYSSHFTWHILKCEWPKTGFSWLIMLWHTSCCLPSMVLWWLPHPAHNPNLPLCNFYLFLLRKTSWRAVTSRMQQKFKQLWRRCYWKSHVMSSRNSGRSM